MTNVDGETIVSSITCNVKLANEFFENIVSNKGKHIVKEVIVKTVEI